MTGHTSFVQYISQDQDQKTENLLSCSNDKSIKIWIKKDNTFECIQTIKNAHDDTITKVIPIDWLHVQEIRK